MLNNNITHTWDLKGKLHCKRKSECKDDSSCLVAPYGVAFTPSQDLVVADMETAQVNVYEGVSTFKLAVNTEMGLQPWKTSHPWQVAVSSDNSKYFLTDHTELVKVYGKDGAYMQRIATKQPGQVSTGEPNSNALLAGLAVDGKGYLFAGEITGNYISKHQEDGTHVRSFTVAVKPWYIAVSSKDQIVVASDSNEGVHVLDDSGNLLHTLEIPKGTITWKPSGVCCSLDNIFVAALCGVYCYSATGDYRYLGAVTKEVLYPRGLAITQGGKKIAVAEEWDVRIFEDTHQI